MRRTAVLALTSLLLGAAVAVAPPAAASVDGYSVELPLTQFRDLVVDVPRGHVYVTGGGSAGIVVRDLVGNAVTTIYGQPGASGMALSPDGSRLYVALAHGDAISAIDTTLLVEVARWETGATTCPFDVATHGTRVWFSYGCSSWAGDVGVIDLAAPAPAATIALLPPGEYLRHSAPYLDLTPDGTRMVSASRGITGGRLYSIAVSGSTLAWDVSRELSTSPGDFALTDDGEHVVVASGAPYYHPRYRVSDLAGSGVYGENQPYPNAVDVAGPLVAAGFSAWYDHDILLFREDGMLLREYELGRDLLANGLVLTDDGATVYAVTSQYPPDSPLRLHVIDVVPRTAPELVLDPPVGPRVGAAFTIAGTLAGVEAGSPVHVTRTFPGAPPVRLPDVVTGADGTFAITDTVGKRGTYGYAVSYDGSRRSLGTTGSASVDVAGLVPSLAIATDRTSYGFRALARVTATLGTTSSRRAVTITASPYGLPPAVVASGDVDASGERATTYTVTRATTFTASFAGDDVYEPRTVSVTRGVGAGLTTTLSGHHGWSGAYRLYRRTAHPVLAATVAPNRAGTCTTVETQRYYSGAWRTVALNRCVRLDASSRISYTLSGTHAPGDHRMRVTFNGDASTLRTTGAWQYLRFV